VEICFLLLGVLKIYRSTPAVCNEGRWLSDERGLQTWWHRRQIISTTHSTEMVEVKNRCDKYFMKCECVADHNKKVHALSGQRWPGTCHSPILNKNCKRPRNILLPPPTYQVQRHPTLQDIQTSQHKHLLHFMQTVSKTSTTIEERNDTIIL
jgi:hypothetical protein